ncbi:hypothetical protein EDD27_1464 [Nonomuraea polychroma]|uniref:Uncharacterized protein n=1 Tax=Nonomuraea polychroma TaxID=46176 RepID=A0A438M0D6_9ACTN|nr:hypothetical protein [Nonomuraea polychroma]RVX39121.1 hypothetical protein EDD27_1464 [Nonomuraea polychroma]
MSAVMTTPDPGQVYEFTAEVPQGQVIRYDLAALCSALNINDPTRIAVETDGLRRAMITVYPSNPLAQVRAVTREDLVMDRHGRIVIGVYHNGRPVKKRLFDPSTGSAQRHLVFGTTGAGKSRVVHLELAAEKINGFVSWLADLKFGQSVPEAEEHVDWPVRTQEGAVLMTMAAVAVAQDRMRRYAAAGRSAFVLGVDPLLNVTLDEANRALERGAPYRDLMTHLIKELGRTGRSVGVGVRLSAQAAHLEELGGSDTLRAMLKEGEVTLLRWSGSMMRQLVADGLLPAGEQLMPIPKTLAPRELRSQFDPAADDDDDAPGTQGMGYLLSGPRPTAMMRHLRVGSIAPLAGKDPEILALYGPGEPARLEELSAEADGENIGLIAYHLRHDPVAFQALCDQFREIYQQKPGHGGGGQHAGGAVDDGPEESADRPRKVLVEDRVRAVLAAADAPMSADEVLAAVNSDGGKQVSGGTVRNKLSALVDSGAAVQPGRGLYAPVR